jgi:NitT/TauT family transport system substrate-binding protein
MNKSKLFGAALTLLGAFSTSTVLAQSAPSKPDIVRIQVYPGAVTLIPLIALEKGYCQKYGITCELVTIPSSVVGLQALLSNGIEVATPAVEAFLQLAGQGSPVRTIGSIYRGSPYMLVLAGPRKDANPKGYRDVIRDLKGKKIGVTTLGSGPYYTLRTFLKDASMNIDDVTPVAVGAPDTAYPSVAHGQIDAAMSFPPMAAFCDVLKTCSVAFWVRDQGPQVFKSFANSMIPAVVRADYSQKNASAVRKAFKDAEIFLQSKENIDEVHRIQEKYVKFENPKAKELTHKLLENILPAQYFSEADPKELKAAIDYMVSTDQLKKSFDPAGYIAP